MPDAALPLPLPSPLVLAILDGWGVCAPGDGNAVAQADTPVMRGLIAEYPSVTLTTGHDSGGSRFPGTSAAAYYRIGTGCRARDRQEAPPALGAIAAKQGIGQLRLADTDRFLQSGYWFDGGREEPFTGEDRQLIPVTAPRDIRESCHGAADAIVKELIRALETRRYGFILASLPFAELAARTGDVAAAVAAVAAVDQALGRIVKAVSAAAGSLVVTAAAGLAEAMLDPRTGQPVGARTGSPVPFILVSKPLTGKSIGWPEVTGSDLSLGEPYGRLIDITPTLCRSFGWPVDPAMQGRSLI